MLVSRSGLSPVMVGRDSELAQLRRIATEATQPAIALIGGEPGIGKTRLASELATCVPPGTRRLLSQADPGGAGQPYQLVLDLVPDADDELVKQLRAADPMHRPAAAVALLRSVVGTGPALLIVDDLHWADPESLAVFEQLEEVTTGPLLLVGTYRPEELSRRHPLAVLLERLDRRRGVTHLRLTRLTPAGTASFLAAVYGRAPGRRTVSTLHDRTGGNPFFLEELLKAAGDTDLDEIGHQPLPWNLAEVLRSQLDGLADQQRQVVEAAAVLGSRVSFDLLATVTGLAESTMLAALGDLVHRGLLVEVEEDLFGFRHTLTREAVTGEMLGRQRRRIHEAALAELQASPDPDLAAVAAHARGAGRYDDLIDAARRGATERLAAGSAYAALILAELGLAEAPDDFPLLVLAGAAAWRAGYIDDAHRHSARALRATSDDGSRVAALTQLIRVAWERGEPTEMAEYTAQVQALSEVLPDGKMRAKAMAAVAQSYMLRGEHDRAVDWADRAYAVAAQHDLKAVCRLALLEKGSALVCHPDSAEQGQRLLAEVAADSEAAGCFLEAARGWHNLFWFLPAGDPAAAEVLERARIAAERAGVVGMASAGYPEGLAQLAITDGDLDAAIGLLERVQRVDLHAVSTDPAHDPPLAVPAGPTMGAYLRGRLAQLYLERGDLDAAEALLADGPDARRWRTVSRGITFQLACHRGDLPEARRLLSKLLATPEEPLGAKALHCQVSAALTVGLSPDELRPLQQRRCLDQKGQNDSEHPLRLLIEAQLAEAEGRVERALPDYLAAVAGRHAAPPSCRGTAAVGAARCLLRLGQVQAAREQLADADAALAKWPGWRRDQLVELRRRLDPAQVAGEADDGPLTAREQEVAVLIGEGLTNAEIARRLVISRKTVAVHVSHILAKLAMSSRTQVAAWVARGDAAAAWAVTGPTSAGAVSRAGSS
ncbi:AAA family ATPase [Natronosporangium hydrolyticum]|uniref:AAA family ATPase n=1 Tax=Natronosporangium hydrolyticum TaxID=2811111 RepID=A0A895YJY5_9ACTN|nr:LuxR C-terminal-related transcriptional regulator [Natronosporangium hydrolyticum]QSB14420.1 AAA family ATPase [Natronosporangium hydrolyticum]